MKPYSYDFRSQVASACIKGLGNRTVIAHLFGVSTSFIRRLFQRFRQTGSFAVKPPGGGPKPKLTPAHEQRLIAELGRHHDATLEQLCAACGAPVTCAAICQRLNRSSGS